MHQPLQNLSDEELARRACAGCAAAYEEIVRRYQAPLTRFLARKFPSRRDVEDILQDTFVKAWQQLHRFDSKYPFRTWLYTISYRLAVSRGRRETLTQEPLPEHAAAANPGLSAEIEREESKAALWGRARQVLSEEQFMALWLFYVDEMPAGEVARVLNRSWVSVKTLLHRARRKLAPLLADLAPAPPEPQPLAIPIAATLKAGET
ncbi:MAG TPA: sigma-70 family RNA polymerase sigma factor [Phycisphaerae bacterium]|jgi:RNA polymerase sigma-70 factor (ECF subfamily)|nr:sigma-70 family RNA polymerase sigma factor [Phycisphaerae bacterium]